MNQTKPGDASPEEIDRQAKAMRDGLRKEAAAWSAAHSAGTDRLADNLGSARPVRQVAPAVRHTPQPTPVTPAKPVAKTNKPFRMSYNGVTTAEHIESMLARGAR